MTLKLFNLLSQFVQQAGVRSRDPVNARERNR